MSFSSRRPAIDRSISNVPSCPACGQDNPDIARFCLACGAQLDTVPGPERRKLASLIFCDLSGSTAMGERLDPESVRDLMFSYFDEMRGVIERHGGTVEKFIGDAVMAVFGVPTAHEDDALRAVRAAAEMQDRMETLNDDLDRRFGARIALRIGVNTGEVVAGDPTVRQTIVTGDAVNVAARLEQAAKPGEVLIGPMTYRLVKDAVSVEPVAPLDLKGKSEPLSAHRLVDVSPTPPVAVRGPAGEMVGRDQELALLKDSFRRAVGERSCRLATVVGEPGVGKTRLAEEFLLAVEPTVTLLRSRCLSYGEGITYWPIRQIVQQAAGITDEDATATAAARLAALLDNEADGDLVATRVGQAIGLTAGSASAEEIHWAIRRLLRALAADEPLVLLVDDIHWAESGLLDLFASLSDLSSHAAIFVLCLARPDLLEARPDWGPIITLDPLGTEASERLIRIVLGGWEVGEDVRRKITHAAGGNPLFVEQLVGMLIDEGLLRRVHGSWLTPGDVSRISAPVTLSALLGARLDRLTPGERSVIERASIEGQTFHREAVMELLPHHDRAEGPERLQALVGRGFIHPAPSGFGGEAAYAFRHILIREAAYDGMPKKLRAELHERFADWRERAAGQRVAEVEEILGYHLEEAHRYFSELGPLDDHGRVVGDRAGSHLAAAGRRAVDRQDLPAAISLLSRATALLPPGTARAEALLGLGTVLWPAMEFVRADAVLAEAIEAAVAVGDPSLEWRAVIERAFVKGQIEEGSWQDLGPLAEQAIETLGPLGDDRGLARAWRLMAMVHRLVGRSTDEMRAFERATEHARRAGDRWQEIESLTQLIVSGTFGPVPAPLGIQRCREAGERAPRDRLLQAAVHECVGVYLAMLGRFDEARDELAGARGILEDLGLRVILANDAVFFTGYVELLAGDPGAAERHVRGAYDVLEEVGERAVLSSAAGVLAESLYRQGRVDEAEPLTRIAEELAASDDYDAQVRWRAVRAKVLAKRGDHVAAEAMARDGVAIVEKTESLNQRGDARMDLAEVLRLGGRPDEAARELLSAISIYEQKDNVVAAGVARRTLETLEADPVSSPSRPRP